MSGENLPISLENLAKSDIALSMQDIVSIRSSQYEDEIRQKLSDKQKEINATTKAIRKTESERTDFVKNLEDKTFGEAKQKLLEVFNAVGLPGAVRYDTHVGKEEINMTLRIVQKSSRGYDTQSLTGKTETITVPDELQVLVDSLVTNNKELNILNSEAMDLQSQLTNIASIERKTRAGIAKAALSSTVDGKALLEQILNTKDVPNLLPERRVEEAEEAEVIED